MSSQLAQQIKDHLATKGLVPTSVWLDDFLDSANPNTPVAALKSTSVFRILMKDIQIALHKPSTLAFPHDIANGEIKQRRLAGPIPVQLLSIEDIGRSQWSQAEALEAEERGEKQKGHEIIRVVPGEDDQAETRESNGPLKVVLQDVQGTCVYGIELRSIPEFGMGMSIGGKMILKDIVVVRGVLLLEPSNITLLGGKLEDLHKKWKDGRKDALKTAARKALGPTT